VRRVLVILILAFFFPVATSADSLPTDLASIGDAIQMDGVAGYVEGLSRRAISELVSRDGVSWMCDAFADAVNNKEGSKGISAMFRQDPALRQAVKERLKEKIQKNLPAAIKETVLTHLLGGIAGSEKIDEALAIYENIMAELNTSINDRIDAVVGNMYSMAIDEITAGIARGIPKNLLDPTDLKGSVERAFDLHNIADMSSRMLSDVVGESTVRGIRKRITDALDGNLPPELLDALQKGPREFEKYANEAKKYLPGRVISELKNSLLNAPAFKLPTPAYVSILAASAAGHFARAFAGVYVDAYELKRGAEVVRVMVWQARNKDSINLSIMQLAGLARDIAFSFGAGASFDEIASTISKPLKRIEEMADKIDEALKGPMNVVSAELRNLVAAIGDELKSLQDTLMAPARDVIGNMQSRLDIISDRIGDAIPENLNGLPKNWEDLKGRLGVDGGILGEDGLWRPLDSLEEAFGDTAAKIGRDFSKVNERLAEHISEGIAGALYGLNLIGPVAAIMEVEKVPAINPSLSDELDPVLLHNGEFFQEITDVAIPGRGLDFKFMRIYRGHSNFLGEFGWRWTHSYAERVLALKEGYTYVDDRGRKFFFTKKEKGYEAPAGLDAALDISGDKIVVRFKDGVEKIFEAGGRLFAITDRHGNRISLYYEGGLVSRIVDSYGRTVRFYRNALGLIEAIEDFAGRRFSYEYNDARELVRAVAPSGASTGDGLATIYEYELSAQNDDRTHRIVSITDPKGSRYLENTYDGEGRTTGQRYGDAPWMRVEYENGQSGTKTRVTDASGRVFIYEHDLEGHLLKKTRLDGIKNFLIFENKYDADGRIIKHCLPSKLCTINKYSDSGLVVSKKRAPDGTELETKYKREANHGRVSEIEYPDGGKLHLEYSEKHPHDLESISKSSLAGQMVLLERYEWNDCGQIAWMVDAAGLETRYEYHPTDDPDGDGTKTGTGEATSCGYLKDVVEGSLEQRKISYLYDGAGNIISKDGPGDMRTDYLINSINQTSGIRRTGRADELYAYDANGNLAEFRQKNRRAVFAYDSLDRMTGVKFLIAGDLWAETVMKYDELGRLSARIDPDDRRIDYEYDELGRVIRVVEGKETLDRLVRFFGYDASGNISKIVEATGSETRYEYDGLGRLSKVERPDGGYRKIKRHKSGEISSEKDFDSSETLMAERRYSYDRNLNSVDIIDLLWTGKKSRAAQVVNKYTFDDAGRVSSIKNPEGGIWRYERNDFGEIISTTDPEGRTKYFDRDGIGRIASEYFLRDNKRYREFSIKYSAPGDILERRFETGRVYFYEYDEYGNLKRESRSGLASTEYEYDLLGRAVNASRRAFGKDFRRKYAWSKGGLLKKFTDYDGKTAHLSHDPLGRVIMRKYPDGTAEQIAYDAGGGVSGIIGRGGEKWRISRDANGRVIKRTALSDHEGTTEIGQKFTYDALGRLGYAEEDGREVHIEYDSLSRAIAQSSGENLVQRGYDLAGNVTNTSIAGLGSVFYSYDKSGLKRGAVDAAGQVFFMGYDESGAIVRAELGDNLKMNVRRFSDGSAMSVDYLTAKDVLVGHFETHLDENGHILADVYPAEITRRFTRDPLGRLAAARDLRASDDDSDASVGEWIYSLADDGGLIVEKETLRDAAGRISQIGDVFLNYDALGRLAGYSHGESRVAFKYDALSRLVGVESGDDDISFAWDGWKILASNSSGKLIFYAYGDELVPVSASEEGQRKFFIKDRIGSVVAYASKGGERADLCRYSPYGEKIGCDDLDLSFCFAGGICDGFTNLVYFRNRFYSPETGSFLTPDPLGFKLKHSAENGLKIGPAVSFHNIQGQASRATFPNRPSDAAGWYGVYPFSTFELARAYPPQGELNLLLYASSDPSRFVDPLGLASLVFDRSDGAMHLIDGEGRYVTSYAAFNVTMKPSADPIEIGGNGPFPDGSFSLGVPEFYSEEYREKFYARFGFGENVAGEGIVNGRYWAKHEMDNAGYSMRFGTIRIRTGGDSSAADRIAWNRGLFIHGGRHNYRARTLGCIRGDDLELETLAANFIAFRRQGDPIDTITVRE